jgi:hypothetical protein
VAISLDQDIVLIQAIATKAGKAAPDVVWAMAKLYEGDVKRELSMRSHAAGTWTNAPPFFSPPSMISGELERSVVTTRGITTGTYAEATVSPHTIYASVQEWGRVIYARRRHFMHWVNDRGEWFKKRVMVPPRPYMRPALEDVIRTGALTRVAMESFERSVWT